MDIDKQITRTFSTTDGKFFETYSGAHTHQKTLNTPAWMWTGENEEGALSRLRFARTELSNIFKWGDTVPGWAYWSTVQCNLDDMIKELEEKL